jgi:TonB family protein
MKKYTSANTLSEYGKGKFVTFIVLLMLMISNSCNSPKEKQHLADSRDEKKGKSSIQSGTQENGSEKIKDDMAVNQEMPEYSGGTDALSKFIMENVSYPESAKQNGIEGKVYVSFTVGKNGRIKNAVVEKGVCSELDAEALRVIKLMPEWKPANNSEVKMILPIQFKLCEASIHPQAKPMISNYQIV